MISKLYTYKGKTYEVLSVGRIKIQVDDLWHPAIEYKNESGVYVRTEFEFLEKFKPIDPDSGTVLDYMAQSEVTPCAPAASVGSKLIDAKLYKQLDYLGLIPSKVRSTNAGTSNYSQKLIQPWAIWLDYPELTSWDHDIIKRILRTKSTDSRKLDYEKIVHIAQERIRQLDLKEQHAIDK